MKLSVFLAKRIIIIMATLFGLSIFVFAVARVLPGDPARLAAGGQAPEWAVEELRVQLGLNKPLYEQYYYWLINLFHGDFGYSLYTRRSVTLDIVEYLPATIELILLAAAFELAGGFLLGVLAGKFSYQWPDTIMRMISYVGMAVPVFTAAIVFQLIFSYGFPIFPSQGMRSWGINPPPRITGLSTVDSLLTGNLSVFLNILWHMILPAFSLALGRMLQDARMIRAGMIENKDKDYLSMARSQGLPERLLLFKYLLKPSIIPAVTVMGMSIANSVANAFVVEQIYNWPGFSRWGVAVMLNKDLNGIVAVVVVVGIMFSIMNIITDLIVAYIDPRIRLMERGE